MAASSSDQCPTPQAIESICARGSLKRVCLKVSGEMLGSLKGLTESSACLTIARQVQCVRDLGLQVCVVVGGGNIFRGGGDGSLLNDQTRADQIGMMATVVNALTLEALLTRFGVPVVVQSAVAIDGVCLPVDFRHARESLSDDRVVVFAAGLGSPFFTTDTAAALRAIECDCDLLIKTTKVPGVYSRDPNVHHDAQFIPYLNYKEALDRSIGVMDISALNLCQQNKIPIVVTSLSTNVIGENLRARGVFTLINDQPLMPVLQTPNLD